MEAIWHYREGDICKTVVTDIKGGAAKTKFTPKCARCGGLGGSDKWARTGWTCYNCAGSGKGATRFVSVYTAAKLEKLNATRNRARAKKAATIAAKARAQREAAQAVRRDLFIANEPVARRAWALRADRFIRDIIRQALGRRPLSSGQVDALNTAVANCELWNAAKKAEADRKAAAQYVGKVGERMTAEVTIMKKIQGGSQWVGYGVWTLTIMRTVDGNTLTTFGHCYMEEGANATIKFTVKAHDVNKRTGERETQIYRIKEVAIAAA